MLKLYTFGFSPNGRKVHLALEEIGEPYEIITVDLTKGEHKRPEYLKLNPNGRVPTLEADGFVIWESNAIVMYLAERFPRAKLVPASPEARADATRWLFYQAQHFGPAIAAIFRHTMRLPPAERDPKRVEEGRAEAGRCLDVLESTLGSRPFLAGDFSFADVGFAPYVAWTPMLGIDLAPYANVRGWLDRMQSRPAWRKVYG